jgi:hypothetical protein
VPASTLKPIDGRPLTRSTTANMRPPALKLGWPHEAVSLVSGNDRQRRRSR